MNLDAIPERSVEEYKNALGKIKLGEKQIEMLNVQYNAPDQTIGVSDLASQLGYSSHISVNGHYGRIGNSVAMLLNIEVTKQADGKWHWWRTIADGVDSEEGVVWKMKPNFAKALEELGITSRQ